MQVLKTVFRTIYEFNRYLPRPDRPVGSSGYSAVICHADERVYAGYVVRAANTVYL